MSYSFPWRLAIAIGGLLAVVMGASAAHGLSHLLAQQALGWIHTAVMYQLIHLGCALAVANSATRSGKFWIVGSWCFSGSLYLLAVLPEHLRASLAMMIGPITPIGGILMMVGWVMLIKVKHAG
ncbi:DUF423 domain-containing protein [Celerinatantimonas diazotrophica]|uniref:Uncharacterized membrane protein YgdD (TMEM256/DUF423 family) n=1 Tax=Celerinatantimonas diazotrophica TaxID=412034 RepID=A0A4R1J9Z3_9GAMM|nr:DUF423 domain-containing protein [Celerinatantimonas diazotrophica]TCK47264.1 uncharacterized membrane protein YgdD (TMEM256/DUF423 family) [Celerinatantimonas diazotrophica]CAG9296036.1 hypothetical protein CEDIAZO_01175 [Celerinatantimonas diazotrophica]